MNDVVPIDLNEAERARRKARLVRSFHIVFGSDEGRQVLEYLVAKFPPDFPRFGPHTKWDPLQAAVLDGQAQVVSQILQFLDQPVGDDATAIPQTTPTNIT